jgi:hypothetical protein
MWAFAINAASWFWYLATLVFNPMPYITMAAQALTGFLAFRFVDDGARKALRIALFGVLVLGSIGFVLLMGMRLNYAYNYAMAEASRKHSSLCQYHSDCPYLPTSHATDVDTITKCQTAGVICTLEIKDIAMNEFMPSLGSIFGAGFSLHERVTFACLIAFLLMSIGRALSSCVLVSQRTPTRIGKKQRAMLMHSYKKHLASIDPDIPEAAMYDGIRHRD